jgi:hypothetical protein
MNRQNLACALVVAACIPQLLLMTVGLRGWFHRNSVVAVAAVGGAARYFSETYSAQPVHKQVSTWCREHMQIDVCDYVYFLDLAGARMTTKEWSCLSVFTDAAFLDASYTGAGDRELLLYMGELDLSNLRIVGCPVTDSGVVTFLRKQPRLTFIDLRGTLVSRRCAIGIASQFPGLIVRSDYGEIGRSQH